MAKITFKVGNNTFIGVTVEQVTARAHKKYKGTDHPYSNYNVLYNAVLKSSKTVEKTISQQPQPQTVKTTQNPFTRPLRAAEAVKASKALFKMNILGLTVDQQEVKRRGDICRGCDLVMHVSDCGSCGGAKRKLATLAGAVTGFFQKKLKLGTFKGKTAIKSYCGHCGCSMQALLPVRVQDYKPEAFDQTRPDYCWLRKDGENFIDS